jgi:hypothetical protein
MTIKHFSFQVHNNPLIWMDVFGLWSIEGGGIDLHKPICRIFLTGPNESVTTEDGFIDSDTHPISGRFELIGCQCFLVQELGIHRTPIYTTITSFVRLVIIARCSGSGPRFPDQQHIRFNRDGSVEISVLGPTQIISTNRSKEIVSTDRYSGDPILVSIGQTTREPVDSQACSGQDWE